MNIGLAKRYKFSQKKRGFAKDRNLAKKNYMFSQEKI
jgi:hypothetical protein